LPLDAGPRFDTSAGVFLSVSLPFPGKREATLAFSLGLECLLALLDRPFFE